MQHERETYIKIYKQMKESPHVHWKVHDILKAFTDEFCQVMLLPEYDIDIKCGEHGRYIIWITLPPKKLCRSCLLQGKYRHHVLNILMRRYGLTEMDIKHVPTIRCIDKHALMH